MMKLIQKCLKLFYYFIIYIFEKSNFDWGRYIIDIFFD